MKEHFPNLNFDFLKHKLCNENEGIMTRKDFDIILDVVTKPLENII